MFWLILEILHRITVRTCHSKQIYLLQSDREHISKIRMSPKYAKDQPASFDNCIEKVAIVGVSESYLNPSPVYRGSRAGRLTKE